MRMNFAFEDVLASFLMMGHIVLQWPQDALYMKITTGVVDSNASPNSLSSLRSFTFSSDFKISSSIYVFMRKQTWALNKWTTLGRDTRKRTEFTKYPNRQIRLCPFPLPIRESERRVSKT
jgi:hypothetical protein